MDTFILCAKHSTSSEKSSETSTCSPIVLVAKVSAISPSSEPGTELCKLEARFGEITSY